MTGKQFLRRAAEFKTDVLLKSETALQHGELIQLAEHFVRFSLAFILSRGTLLGGACRSGLA